MRPICTYTMLVQSLPSPSWCCSCSWSPWTPTPQPCIKLPFSVLQRFIPTSEFSTFSLKSREKSLAGCARSFLAVHSVLTFWMDVTCELRSRWTFPCTFSPIKVAKWIHNGVAFSFACLDGWGVLLNLAKTKAERPAPWLRMIWPRVWWKATCLILVAYFFLNVQNFRWSKPETGVQSWACTRMTSQQPPSNVMDWLMVDSMSPLQHLADISQIHHSLKSSWITSFMFGNYRERVATVVSKHFAPLKAVFLSLLSQLLHLVFHLKRCVFFLKKSLCMKVTLKRYINPSF